MTFEPNDGQRVSRLHLDRYVTGELPTADAADVASRIGPAEADHLSALADARAEMPPFDAAAIRARAAAARRGANNTVWFRAAAGILAVAALLLFAFRRDATSPTAAPVLIARSAEALDARDIGADAPYDGRALGQGDALGFTLTPAGHTGVVLLSVDGAGAVTVFWPASGDAPEPIPADATRFPMPEQVVLDGAPGPEVFVAVFDRTVEDARRLVAEHAGPGLVAWAEETPGVDAVEVKRR